LRLKQKTRNKKQKKVIKGKNTNIVSFFKGVLMNDVLK